METTKTRRLDPLSGTSLFLELHSASGRPCYATGFIVERNEKFFLVTSRHVLSGRHPETDAALSANGEPSEVVIWHHAKTLGEWQKRTEPLVRPKGTPIWFDHPKGRRIDVAVLKLNLPDNAITAHALPLGLADTDIVPAVAMPVHIIGFPLALKPVGMFPIWKTGYIASEPELDYSGKPAFLVDGRTKPGMSGSPVILRLFGSYRDRKGNFTIATVGPKDKFMGIYSAHFQEDADIGIVWRPSVIDDILKQTD